MQNLQQFLLNTNKFPNNGWIAEPGLEAYIRCTRRMINDQILSTLDVANISQQPKDCGKGHFRTFIIKIEAEAKSKGLIVYVENVINPTLETILLKYGYKQTVPQQDPPSFWKEP